MIYRFMEMETELMLDVGSMKMDNAYTNEIAWIFSSAVCVYKLTVINYDVHLLSRKMENMNIQVDFVSCFAAWLARV